MNGTGLRAMNFAIHVTMVGALLVLFLFAAGWSGTAMAGGAEAQEQGSFSGPGWIMATVKPLSDSALETKANNATRTGPTAALLGAATLSATFQSPEIKELARALLYDPKLIYDYVHNHIEYTPYYGSLKGATLTLLDGCGNDFD